MSKSFRICCWVADSRHPRAFLTVSSRLWVWCSAGESFCRGLSAMWRKGSIMLSKSHSSSCGSPEQFWSLATVQGKGFLVLFLPVAVYGIQLPSSVCTHMVFFFILWQLALNLVVGPTSCLCLPRSVIAVIKIYELETLNVVLFFLFRGMNGDNIHL